PGERGADNAGAWSEFTGPEPDAAQMRRQLTMQRLEDHRLEHIERSGDAAGNDDGLGIEQSDGTGECSAECVHRGLEGTDGDGLAVSRGVDERRAAGKADAFGSGIEGAAGSVAFEPAAAVFARIGEVSRRPAEG